MAKHTPKYMKKHRTGFRLTGKLTVLLLLAMVVLGAAVWGVNARYVHQSENNGIVKAKEFYFTSDYLTPGGAEYTLNPGTTEVTFELRSYDGLKKSELSVNFTVEKNGEEVETGVLDANTDEPLKVTLKDLTPGSYTVTATGENGYSRTLSATFVVKAAADGIYKHTENYGDYVILTVWTQGIEKTAEVTIPTDLIPDYTDANLNGKSGGSTFTVTLAADESVSYRFFTTGDYNTAPITVTSGSALPETPLS